MHLATRTQCTKSLRKHRHHATFRPPPTTRSSPHPLPTCRPHQSILRLWQLIPTTSAVLLKHPPPLITRVSPRPLLPARLSRRPPSIAPGRMMMSIIPRPPEMMNTARPSPLLLKGRRSARPPRSTGPRAVTHTSATTPRGIYSAKASG